jgi:hypothetical protein
MAESIGFGSGGLGPATFLHLAVNENVAMRAGLVVLVAAAAKVGGWQGTRCSSEPKAMDRGRIRALKAHRELVFRTAGAVEPSQQCNDGDVHDARHRTCQPTPDARRAITLQMQKGEPVPAGIRNSGSQWRRHPRPSPIGCDVSRP